MTQKVSSSISTVSPTTVQDMPDFKHQLHLEVKCSFWRDTSEATRDKQQESHLSNHFFLLWIMYFPNHCYCWDIRSLGYNKSACRPPPFDQIRHFSTYDYHYIWNLLLLIYTLNLDYSFILALYQHLLLLAYLIYTGPPATQGRDKGFFGFFFFLLAFLLPQAQSLMLIKRKQEPNKRQYTAFGTNLFADINNRWHWGKPLKSSNSVRSSCF